MAPIFLNYDPEFLKEEVRNEHLVTTEVKKLWLFQLDMLNKFIQVCDKYNLVYWAEGGTLLGAVRHNGYIPWDDDIDIIMFRDDYEKFLKIANDEFKYPYYIESERFTRIKRLDTTHLKLNGISQKLPALTPMCISIDIFCMDNCPENQEDITMFHNDILCTYNDYLKCKHLYTMSYHDLGKSKEELNKCKKEVSDKLEAYQRICQSYNNIDTIYVYNSGLPKYKIEDGHMRYREDYDESIYLPFEMLTLRCPKGYDRILTMHYTDRNGIPWQTPVKNFAYHNQNKKAFLDFDNPYTLYTFPFYDRPEDLEKISS